MAFLRSELNPLILGNPREFQEISVNSRRVADQYHRYQDFQKTISFQAHGLDDQEKLITNKSHDLANGILQTEKFWPLILFVLTAFLFFKLTLLPSAKKLTHGFAAYYTASRLVIEHRSGSSFYDDEAFHAEVSQMTHGQVNDIYWANPPTAALMFMPLAPLPIGMARIVWSGALLISLFCAVAILDVGIFGKPLEARTFFIATSLLFFSAPVAANFQFGQVYLLLLIFYAVALLGLQRGQDRLAGLFLALPLVFKASGLPLLLLLIMHKKWRALIWTGLLLATILLLSVPLVGLSTWRVYLFSVLPGFLSDPVITATAYQTVPGFTRHLFVYDPIWNPNPLVHWPTVASLFSVLVTIALVGVASRWSRKSSSLKLFCLGLILSVILVPAAEQHHYVLLLPAAMLAVRSRRVPKVLLSVAVVLIAWPLNYVENTMVQGWGALLAYPRLYGAILLFVALLFHEDDSVVGETKAINIDAYARAQ